MKISVGFLLALGSLFIDLSYAQAQPVIPFGYDAVLEDATTSDSSKYNTGGTITVMGTLITVPQNLLVQFPAAWVPWKDFVEQKASLAGYEINVQGNVVNNVPIAGTIQISELLTGGGSGTVQSVNNDGTLQILGGPRLRINTPNGIFATAYTSKPFFTADEANPSIVSFSGYPMCIPRTANDPDCLASNRAANGARVYTPANTSAMAPFLVGDYVSWSGIRNGGNEILCFAVTAENVQMNTRADNGDPVYVRVEDVLIGVNDASANTEFADSRFIGYVSDSTATVTVYRIEIDPCTGVGTEIQVGAGPLKTGDVRNKFEVRFKDTVVTKSAREYRVKASKGAKVVAAGIQAGQYVSAVTEVVWPEVDVPGSPWPANAFQLFSQNREGYVFDGKQYGPLSPWPGATAPTPAKVCTGRELDAPPPPTPPPAGAVPVAAAGADLTSQVVGSEISITGSNSNTALTNSQLTYSWTQTLPSGENLAISNANTPVMSFTAPWQTVTSKTREFQLKICLATNTASCSTGLVQVITDKFRDTIRITAYSWQSKQSGTIAVSASSNNVLKGTGAANLQLQLAGSNTWINMVQDGTNTGLYTYSSRSVGKQPTSISVRSSQGGLVSTSAFVKRSWRHGIEYVFK